MKLEITIVWIRENISEGKNRDLFKFKSTLKNQSTLLI